LCDSSVTRFASMRVRPIPRHARGGREQRCRRKIDGERASLARNAVDLERAAMMVDDVLDDGEPKTRAAKVARTGSVDPVESLGQARDVLARNAVALVVDGDGDGHAFAAEPSGQPLDRLAGGWRRDQPARYADGRARAPVLDRVVDQVLEHLHELVDV